jgi:hypothetical protein
MLPQILLQMSPQFLLIQSLGLNISVIQPVGEKRCFRGSKSENLCTNFLKVYKEKNNSFL